MPRTGRGPRGTLREPGIAAAALVLACGAAACVAVPPGGYPVGIVPEPASIVEASPATSVASLGTRHVVVATARDDGGRPVPNTPVEWVLVAGSAGTIDAVDGGDGRPARAHDDVRSASSRTAELPYELRLGDDTLLIEVGQTWCVLSSGEEGASDLLVYSPATPDRLWGEQHARCRWVDAAFQWPLTAERPAGSPYTLVTRVASATGERPLAGYAVTYEALPGTEPPAAFGAKSPVVTVTTDGQGVASAKLVQQWPDAGTCVVRVTIAEPAERGGDALATRDVTVTWSAKDAPPPPPPPPGSGGE